jgi:hypothetical protein
MALGRKQVASGDSALSADFNALVDQSVMVFASASARDSALLTPTEGMVCTLVDLNSVQVYNGSAWVDVVQHTAWTTFTPTLSGPTTFGTTMSAKYAQTGKNITFKLKATYSSVTVAGSGTITLTLPVTAANSDGVFTGIFYNNSTYYPITFRQTSTTQMTAYWMNSATPTQVTAASPTTVAAGMFYQISGSFEAA